jgi:plastocyanin
MHRRATLALALLAAVAIGGCGSGESPPAHSSEAQRTTTTPSSGAPPGLSAGSGSNPKYAAPPSGGPQSGTVQVAYREISIDPDSVKVKAGTTVRWTNYDPVEHNVTSQSGPASFSSGNFSEGHTFEVKFTKPGVYHYKCTIHPTTMNGTIDVVR